MQTTPGAKRSEADKLLQTKNILTGEYVRAIQSLGLESPFLALLYFVKGELKDIKAMDEALTSRSGLLTTFKSIGVRRVAIEKQMEDILKGNIKLNLNTLKGLFKNNTEKVMHTIELSN